MKLNANTKIFVAGHNGLVGSAIWNNLKKRGYNNLIGRTHKELDLTNQAEVEQFFKEEKPEAVILAAAFVGGIMANSVYRADFIMQNLQIQCNVIDQCFKNQVAKVLCLGSTCIYPKNAPQPMTEECLLTSELEYTNEPYAIAKIAGLKLCESYNLQYGTNYIAVMPTNLYGPNDNFHLENSHVMPAMIRKIYLSKLLNEQNWTKIRKDIAQRPIENIDENNTNNEIENILSKYGIHKNKVVLWGSGKPLREFLWSEDMADACVHILLNVDFSDIVGFEKYSSNTEKTTNKLRTGGAIPDLGNIKNCHINIGSGKEVSIKELALLIADTLNYEGDIVFDTSKPDGTMRKLTDVSKLHSLGWQHSVEINEGIKRLFDWYKSTIE